MSGRVEEVRDRVHRDGLAHEEPLSHRGAHCLDLPHVLLGVDALGDHRQREVMPKVEDRLEQPAAVVLVFGGSEGTAVHLQEVKRHLLKGRAVGIPGAEVVDRDAHTQPLDLLHARNRHCDVVHDRALGDLEREQRRLDP